MSESRGNVKGGAIRSRLEFIRDRGGEPAVQRVLARLPEADRQICAQILTGNVISIRTRWPS